VVWSRGVGCFRAALWLILPLLAVLEALPMTFPRLLAYGRNTVGTDLGPPLAFWLPIFGRSAPRE